jgi:hypothetical protein
MLGGATVVQLKAGVSMNGGVVYLSKLPTLANPEPCARVGSKKPQMATQRKCWRP